MLDLERTLAARFPHWFEGHRARIARPLTRALANSWRLPRINEFLRANAHLRGLAFVDAALGFVNARYVVDHVERERIPERGRCLIVANHPLGAVDALTLLKMVGDVRRDVRILANDMLGALEGLQDLILPLRILGGRPTPESLRAIEDALNAEMAVIVFPAGEVSRLSLTGVRDGRWQRGFLRYAQRTLAPIVPVHIKGRNSAWFYGAAVLHRPLGAALLPREMFSRAPRRVEFRIGNAKAAKDLLDNERGMATALAEVRRAIHAIGRGRDAWSAAQAPLAHAADCRAIRAALSQLEPLGSTADGKQILCGKLASDSPLLAEIARLRELSFRAVGEGSGSRCDTDRYDTWYEHIVLWDADAGEIAGAYRVADCARIVAERGLQGLYTTSLFDFDPSVIALLEHGMELGRSFVQPRYWGTRSLDYLWYGIGAYLRRHPQIRFLFGPVSISAALPLAAREQLVAYYSRYYGETGALARSQRPFRFTAAAPEFGALDHAASFQLLRRNLDALGARVPTLFKQYTELCEPGGARFLAFGVDPAFADSVDGLILVDLDRVKPKKRERYLQARAEMDHDTRALPAHGTP